MIAFASAVTAPEVYARCAERGFALAAEPGWPCIAQPARGSIFATYNAILDRVAGLGELEALVLAHQDVEIVDADFAAKVRAVLRDPEVAVIGCVGAVGVRTIAWWEGAVTWASFIHRYHEYGGGDFPSLTWDPDDLPPYAHKGEADTVDGLLMVLSAWAVANLRFDESLGIALHGYDYDLCLQARAAGKRVMTEELRVIHHHSLDLVDDPEPYVHAHMALADKWDGRLPEVASAPGDWVTRARRAQAEASVTRAQARAWQLSIDRAALRHRRALDEIAASASLRVTAPLRRAGARLPVAARRRRSHARPA